MKIFRKIRFNSLTKNGIGKYFAYATGEIILVVIGILIALYLNGKKEISDNKEKQKNHLVLLKEELENNLETLDEEDIVLSEIISNIKDLSNIIASDVSLEQISELDLSSILFLPISRAIDVDYENVAYKEFIASNSITGIQNDSTRTILRSWDRKLHTLKLQEQVVQESLKKTVNFIEISGSLKTVLDNYEISVDYLDINNSTKTYSNKSILESRQFENILLQYLGVATQLSKKNYPRFKNDIKTLIDLIEDTLNEG